jgi:ribosomal-protein-alanine N-acetyltransferase
LCLSSLVAQDVGHITQVCVLPAWQGEGVGYALLRRSLLALHERGCRKVSLTVTAANSPAARLYERMGFRTVRRFPAYVWEGLGAAQRGR